MSTFLRSTTTARGVSYAKETLDTMLNDGDDAGGAALRSLLLKLSLVIPLPFIIAFRIMGFQWADDKMSGGAPAALTSLVGSVFSTCTLPAFIVLRFGVAELRECLSMRYLWFVLPGVVNGAAKVFLFAGVKSVDATVVTVIVQCGLLWIVAFHASFRRRCPSLIEVLGIVSIVGVAAAYVLAQSTADRTLNVGGLVLVFVGVVLDDFGCFLVVCCSSSDPSLPEHLRALVANDIAKIPVLLASFVFLEMSTLMDHDAEGVLSVPYLVGACMASQLYVLYNNLCNLVSGQFYASAARTLSVLVTYALEVVVLQTRRLEASAVLQLVGLTAIVLLISVIEYKLVEAEFQGRRGALLNMRQKMSTMRSTWQRSGSRSSDLVRRTSTVPGETTRDAGARVRTADLFDRTYAGDFGASAGHPTEQNGLHARK